jgi:hypothetical protein
MEREKIPEAVKLKLWVKSAGRCEFKGCNEPVWHNGLTLSENNFAEVAHIIGASNKGPRGTDESKLLQTDFSNLMLLCMRCHKEIDDHPEKYPADLLRKWKQEHEDRIEIQTSHPEDINRSTVLFFSVNIGDRIVPINFEAVRNAMFPKYPTNFKGISITETDFNRNATAEEWQSFAQNKIKRRIEKEFEVGTDEVSVKHISVFAIAPMPLLIYLGKTIGDTVPCDIYQSQRSIEDTNKTWNWQDKDSTPGAFSVQCLRKAAGDIIVLKLCVSDNINEDKYTDLLEENISVYEISAPDFSPHFARTKKHLELFSYEYRKLLNQIQAEHGKYCKVLLLPAVPVSFAVECGRVILPNKDPHIYVCEYYKEDGGFKQVLKIN